MTDPTRLPAYGGPGWRPREQLLRHELGSHWGACGLDSEWRPLRSVLLHRPGPEMETLGSDPQASLMEEAPDLKPMQAQHDALADTYRSRGVEVHYVDPPSLPSPNQVFVADLMAMTPEGAILARPASEVRAGEERWVARALADQGVPILRSVRGGGTFEGADLMWLGPDAALLAQGLRTNAEGARQVQATLGEMGVRVFHTLLPPGTMHLMGQLRIVDRNLAIGWPGRLPNDAVGALKETGFEVHFLPDEEEALRSFALNVVVLGPREIVMPSGNPESQAFYGALGVTWHVVEVDEIGKAAGSIGCSTGVLEREREGPG